MNDLVREAGVQVLLQHTATDVLWDRGRIAGVVAHGVSGRLDVEGRAVIDATRDGAVAALAGAAVVAERGADVRAAPSTVVMPLADVRLQAAVRSPFGIQDMVLWSALPGTKRPAPVFAVGTLEPWRGPLAQEGLAVGGYVHCHAGRRGGAVLALAAPPGDDPLDPWGRSAGELENARRADGLLRFLRRHVQGFRAAARLGPPVTLWEPRRIVGEYVLGEEDLLEGRRFVDCVGRGAHPLPGAPGAGAESNGPFVPLRRGGAYEIPYRSLLPHGVSGLLMAGRGLSADPRALAALRALPAGFVVGEAAGTAAALAALTGQDVRHLDMRLLQRTLVKNGASLGRAFADL
jgi:hypothetical protein